jgi:pyruvate/2-oxoglutarate dehydrogenase complex dihydrolipoamide acyltransferase (E2) component
VHLPKSRLATVDLGRLWKDKHYMFGLLEVDVTLARRAARSLRTQGQLVSFTAWMIKAIASSISRNKYAQAMSLSKMQNVVFNDVDIAMPVERIVAGTSVPLPLLIKETNKKTVQQIQTEIDAAIGRTIENEKDFILNKHQFSKASLRLYYSMPQCIRTLLMKWVFRNPFRAKMNAGTVMVTTVNAIGKSAGWIIPTRNMHSIAVSLGSITGKPWICNGEVAIRDIMHLTITFDHDVIDGVPARRFVQDLVSCIEKGVLSDGNDP